MSGILALSFYTPAGVILMIVGVVLSTSGAFMAILSAILTLFTSSSDKSDKNAEHLYSGPNPAGDHNREHELYGELRQPYGRAGTLATSVYLLPITGLP